jgi:hypothetical protein
MKTFDRTLKENRNYYDGYIYKSIPVDKLVDLGLFEVKQYKNGKTKKVKSKGNVSVFGHVEGAMTIQEKFSVARQLLRTMNFPLPVVVKKQRS